MRRLLGFLLVVVCLYSPTAASAHALDVLLHDMRVQVQPTQIVVTVHLLAGPLITPRLWDDLDRDQSGDASDAEVNAWCARIEQGISLQFDGVPLSLQQGAINEFARTKAAFIGASATNLEWIVSAQLPPAIAAGEHQLVVNSLAYADISVADWSKTRGRAGIVVREFSVNKDSSVVFPIKIPATFKNDGTALPDAPATAAPTTSTNDTLIQRLRTGDSSWQLMLATLGLALVFGALHALQPGHGKTLVAAYLVGSRGTITQAIWLGSIVTFTHTASVFGLGTLVLVFSAWVKPQQLIPALTVISGVLVVVVGVRLLWQRIQYLRGKRTGHDHGDGIFHTHSGEHSHHVSHGSLVSLGISGGIVPCPEALAIMIVAATIGRIGLGLAMIIAFSVGLAAVLITLGIVLVGIGERAFTRIKPDGVVIRWLPVASATLVIGLGIVLALQGITL